MTSYDDSFYSRLVRGIANQPPRAIATAKPSDEVLRKARIRVRRSAHMAVETTATVEFVQRELAPLALLGKGTISQSKIAEIVDEVAKLTVLVAQDQGVPFVGHEGLLVALYLSRALIIVAHSKTTASPVPDRANHPACDDNGASVYQSPLQESHSQPEPHDWSPELVPMYSMPVLHGSELGSSELNQQSDDIGFDGSTDLVLPSLRRVRLLDWFDRACQPRPCAPASLPVTYPIVKLDRNVLIQNPKSGNYELRPAWRFTNGTVALAIEVSSCVISGHSEEKSYFDRIKYLFGSTRKYISGDTQANFDLGALMDSIMPSAISELAESANWCELLRKERGRYPKEALLSQAYGHPLPPGAAQGTPSAFEAIGGPPWLQSTRFRDWGWIDERLRRSLRPSKASSATSKSNIARDLTARLIEPQGEELGASLARLSQRLDAARPPDRYQDGALELWAKRKSRLMDDPNHPIVVAGDPEPYRAEGRKFSAAEYSLLFSGSVPSIGSASHPDFIVPFGSVIVIPRGEPAYIRGRGWGVSRDRHVTAWDWRSEQDMMLPIGGVAAVETMVDGRINRSPIPIGEAVHYGGMRWHNLDGSGALHDESLHEQEDRRCRMRAQIWPRMRDGADHDGFAQWSRQPGWIMSGPPVRVSQPQRTGTLEPTPSTANWSPGISPSILRFYFWTMVGTYMPEDDWNFGAGEWRWPAELGPNPRTVIRETLAFHAKPETWNQEWNDPAHNRTWLGGKITSHLHDNPALAQLPGCAPDCADPAHGPLLAESEADLRRHLETIDQPEAEEILVDGKTARRRDYEALKSQALGCETVETFLAEAQSRIDFDKEQDALADADLDKHRDWMQSNCRIAYLPNPKGDGPFDGPDAEVVVRPWSWDFMPEPLVAPLALQIPAREGDRTGVAENQPSFPYTTSARQGVDCAMEVAPGETGPDDHYDLRLRDAELQGLSIEELERQQRSILANVEALLFGPPRC